LSLREALQLGHHYIGTEHILLGVLSEGAGVGAQVLVGFGADLDGTREQVIQILHGRQPEGAAPADLRAELAAVAARLAVIERKLRDQGAGAG
jgi:ATP-dependent Clp protease ATP-binding subunit ClpC